MPQKLTRVSLSAEAQAGADAVIGWYISEGAFIAAEDFTEEIDSALTQSTQPVRRIGRKRCSQPPVVASPWFSLFPDLSVTR